MKTIEYALMCWEMEDGAILGHLVGTDYQVVGESVKKVKGLFTDYIVRSFKDNSYFYDPELSNYSFITIPLRVRPHYREIKKIYPVKEEIQVTVHAIYGRSEYDYYECFIPMLDQSFYFYRKDDLAKLAAHFARDVLQGYTPGEIYRLLIPGTPWKEVVSVKVPVQKPEKAKKTIDYSEFRTLTGVAEQLPYPRKERGSLKPGTAWERGKEIDRLISLALTEGSNILILGKSGVGKSAIITEAIRKMHSREKSKDAVTRRSFWRTTPSRMTAQARYLGEWQEICEDLVEECGQANAVLWMENFVSLATTGGDGPEDSIAAFITPFIRKGWLQLISEVTPEELEVMRRMLPGFVSYFRIIRVEEMDPATSMKIFQYFNELVTKSQELSFSQQAMEFAYVLLDRFIRYDSFPGKAVRFLSACARRALLQEKKVIRVEDVIEQFSLQTGMPEVLLRDDIRLDSEELTDFFRDRIHGQDHVIGKICSLIKVFKAGLNDPNKPVATMIFAGPTGVGKTATAKALADYLFGIGQAYKPLIRLDMSEFQHGSQIYRLIGPQGKLIRHVREKPFGVVLFDEIEKANPLIFDALLTVLDEGILLDSAGRITDFRNSIIIMTSNLGSTQRSSLGFTSLQDHNYEADIRGFFRPEFFNRIDMCLAFNSLEENVIREIAVRELRDIESRDGIAQRNLRFTFTEALVAYIAHTGFDKKYGARPLQREIERLIVAPLARRLVETPGLKEKTITVDYQDQKVVFL